MPGKLKTQLENQGSQGGSRRPEPRAPSAPGGLSAGGCMSPPVVAPGRPPCHRCLPLPSGGSPPRSRGHQLQAEVISDLRRVRGPCPGDCPHPGGGASLGHPATHAGLRGRRRTRGHPAGHDTGTPPGSGCLWTYTLALWTFPDSWQVLISFGKPGRNIPFLRENEREERKKGKRASDSPC